MVALSCSDLSASDLLAEKSSRASWPLAFCACVSVTEYRIQDGRFLLTSFNNVVSFWSGNSKFKI